MVALDNLFDDAEEIAEAPVKGKWFPIRLTPDLATGELFNIGVGFVDHQRKLHTKLIDSARAFQCMYGPTGLDNFTYLLTVVREHFQRTERAESPTPHITFGPKSFASGQSVQEIIQRLFDAIVTLARHADDDDADETGVKRVDNKALRVMVFKEAKKKSESIFNRLFKKEPIILPDRFGQKHELDLPIYTDDLEMFRNGPRFGTFVSGFFRSPVYRGYNLDGGARNIWNGHSILPQNSQGGLFILRPPEGTKGYNREVMNDIDNEIDRMAWPFLKMPNMRVEIASDPALLADYALAMAE